MNPLTAHLLKHRIDPCLAMNHLQNHGIVSDNAIWPEDVSFADCNRAIAWIKANPVPEGSL